MLVGYEHLRHRLGISALRCKRPARVLPVKKIEVGDSEVAVPSSIAPGSDSVLEHILFALKHEGVRLDILAQALPFVEAPELESALGARPNGQYLRKAAFLWEAFTGQLLSQPQAPGGAAVPLFDPERYITGPKVRDSRWRVEFNGLGSLGYCATVERTPTVSRLLAGNVLGRAKTLYSELPEPLLDRAVSWAYLHETEGSFAIEREAPSGDKASRFAQLLQQAHDAGPLSEERLCELQRVTVSNPFDQAVSFRTDQNHLRGPLRGVAGVTYVPPPPDLCRSLMSELMSFANAPLGGVPPMIKAAIVSFGFVFLHPFMDGNGRLSRYLAHQSLCASNALAKGTLLPMSVAMKKHEASYLGALQSYSQGIREHWDISWLDDEEFSFQFQGSEALYRYWDATECAEFLLRMADQALDVELRSELVFLERYDRLYKSMNDRFDVRGSDLSRLVVMCLDQGGKVSENRRKQYRYRVPDALFESLEAEAKALFSQSSESDLDGGPSF